jgi:Asp-tRNA(Asn)/Glu-tRNA(Gln) amidotransferase A subunit family amidase
MSGASITGAQYGKALLRRMELQAEWRAGLLRHQFDAVVTAVSPGVAWRIGDLTLRERHGDRSMRMAFNVLGIPVLALPIGVSGDGLPIAMQIVAPNGGECLLHRIGCGFERRRARHDLLI